MAECCLPAGLGEIVLWMEGKAMNRSTRSMLWACALINSAAVIVGAGNPSPTSKSVEDAEQLANSVSTLEANPSATSEDVGQPLVAEVVEAGEQALAPLYSPATGVENFEAGFPDAYWAVGDLDAGRGSDFWDDVTCNHVSGSKSAWSSGAGSQTECDFYDDNMEAFMCVEAEYSGSSHNNTDRFYFSLWNEVEDCCDFAWISVGGFSHEPLHGIGVCTPQVAASVSFRSTPACVGTCTCHHGRCWSRVRIRLGPGFNDFPFLRICFRFHSDQDTHREGAYFDDIRFNGLSDTAIFPIHGGFNGRSCGGVLKCGGFAGTPCPEGFECYFGPDPDFPCGTADRTGLCRQYPAMCPSTSTRVCGCNGVTYQNECFAARAHAEVAHNGPCCTSNTHCDAGEFCQKDDGQCDGGGECADRPNTCPGTIDRVCGCNGQTYDNRCRAHQAGVDVAHAGACDGCPGAPFTIGGAVYSDCDEPLTTGIPDTRVMVTCGANVFEANTSGPQGLWQLAGIPCGTCTVCPHKPGHSFAHVGPGCQEEGACHTIVVSQGNQSANQSIQFVGTEGCTPFDLNYDGFPSIIGDVPLAVDCIYQDNCHCPGQGCLCPADCNCDGFLSIIGDVPCLVDCFYHQDCVDRCGGTAGGAISIADATNTAGFAQLFTIGGAVYTDLNEPLSSGLLGVTMTLACKNRPNVTTMTSGGQGLWSFTEVPEGICTVTPSRTGFCFEHVDRGTPGGQASLMITVDSAHQQQNESIQFVASTDCRPPALGACCLPEGTCSMSLEKGCIGRFLGEGLTCSGDPDNDGVPGCDDVCPTRTAPGGVDARGRPLGDLTRDCNVGLEDFQIFQNNFADP